MSGGVEAPRVPRRIGGSPHRWQVHLQPPRRPPLRPFHRLRGIPDRTGRLWGLAPGFLKEGGALGPRQRLPRPEEAPQPRGDPRVMLPTPSPARSSGGPEPGGRGWPRPCGLAGWDGARTSPPQRIPRQLPVTENRDYFRGLPPPPYQATTSSLLSILESRHRRTRTAALP